MVLPLVMSVAIAVNMTFGGGFCYAHVGSGAVPFGSSFGSIVVVVLMVAVMI